LVSAKKLKLSSGEVREMRKKIVQCSRIWGELEKNAMKQ